MTNSRVARLNRKLTELGFVRGGTLPRFQWIWAPDEPYWRTRLGKVWVLCQWEPPRMTQLEWMREFGLAFRYPEGGMYHPFSDTAIPHEPNEALTQNYVWAIDRQMSTSFASHYMRCQNEAIAEKEREDKRWLKRCFDDAENLEMLPAFNQGHMETRVPGTKEWVSFGGV